MRLTFIDQQRSRFAPSTVKSVDDDHYRERDDFAIFQAYAKMALVACFNFKNTRKEIHVVKCRYGLSSRKNCGNFRWFPPFLSLSVFFRVGH